MRKFQLEMAKSQFKAAVEYLESRRHWWDLAEGNAISPSGILIVLASKETRDAVRDFLDFRSETA